MNVEISKCLVVGSGSIACRHINNLRQLLPHADIACVSASGRVLSANDTQATINLGSFEKALAWKPDMAVIASPAPLHLRHALQLLETGIHVLIEKPLSDSLERHGEMAERLLNYRDRIEIAYNLRFLSSFKQMKALLAAHKTGRIYSIHIDIGQYLPDWRPQSDYRRNVSANRSLGGGVLLELSHEFDYLINLFGQFDRVFGITRRSSDLAIDVEDSADILLTRSDDVVAQLHMDFLQRKATRHCKVIGQEGTLHWDLIANSIKLETATSNETLFCESETDRNSMYLELMQGFIQFALGNTAPRISYKEGLEVLTLVDAIRRSSETGMPVNLSTV